jgi:hypothetical protein
MMIGPQTASSTLEIAPHTVKPMTGVLLPD